MDDKLRKRIAELVKEEISIASYNLAWPKMFEEADIFAAYLLMLESEFEKLAESNLSIYELAERFEVLPYFAKFRIGLAKHYSPKKYAFLWK